MKEMSLQFTLMPEEYEEYNRHALKPNIRNTVIRLFLMLIAVVAIAVIAGDYGTGIIMGALLSVIIILTPFISKSNIKKAFFKSYQSKANITVDFYDDHIVEKIDDFDTLGIETETHFPFEIFIKGEETELLYVLFISPMEALIVPKRVMTPEDKEKMNNFMSNIFSERQDI